MRFFRTLGAAAVVLFAGAVFAQTTPPPAGPTTGGKVPAPTGPTTGGKVPGKPMLIFPGDEARTATTAIAFPDPLFRTPDVARSLRLTDRQITQLNTATEQLQAKYREQYDRLNTLPERERADRRLQLNREYTAAWLTGAKEVLEAQQLARYQQLQMQFDGFATLTNPEIQRRLTLTEAQLSRLPDAIGWSDLQMQAILRQAAIDRARGLQLYSDYYQAYQDRLNQYLNVEQQRIWREMTGDPFQFPAPIPTPVVGPQPRPGPTTGGTVPPAGPTTGGTTPPKM